MESKKQVPCLEGWLTMPPEEPRIIGSKCMSCGHYFFPKAQFCRNPDCKKTEAIEDVRLSRRGKLFSYTVNHYPPPPPYHAPDPFTPFGVACVEMPEGIKEVQEKGIEVIEKTEVTEVSSNEKGTIDKIICKRVDSEEIIEYKLDCLFILSHIPSNTMFKKAGVELDEKGNIKVDGEQQTNIKGVYAAGDVTGGLFQVAFAVAEGARAGINASKYLRSLLK